MRIGEIDFPEALLATQREGGLAVFAGAGVSMPPPSNYPDFKSLANQVAGGVEELEPGEPIDRFLGRLGDRGTNVHQMVGRILTNPASKPNSLHFDLLRLFPSAEAMRLVTTNFDPHFSTAAPAIFTDGKPCEIHYAPALPLGNSFSGVVYLHGGVEKPFERLVLTDADFGRAYLTEGWARVFLQKLFEKYTVLFVGYSHNDPVMNYLARGLPPAAGTVKRFALTAAGEEESWKFRGIIPITYRLAGGANSHAAVPAAIGAWAKQVRLGVLEREQRIKSIVELPPPIDPEDGDYIESALSEPATTRFVTRHANTVAWLKWVEDKKFFQRLFDPSATLTDVDAELGGWFVERFQCEHVGESLSVLRRQGNRLSPYLWHLIALRLFRDAPTIPTSEAVHRWLAVLLNYRPLGTNVEHLEHLSTKLVFPEDTVAAVLLFEYLTRPVFLLENDLWSEVQESGEDVKFELATHGGGFWLNDFWTRFFLPNLAALIDKLEPLVMAHLQQAYWLEHTEGTDRSWDALSFSRNIIEQPDQGARRDGFGVLVDVGFAVIEWNAQHRPSRADALIDLWFTADSFLLKRLAILGVSLVDHWTADHKLRWLLDKDLLFKRFLKHEIFGVLKPAYLQASVESRKAVLERARQGPQPVPEGGETTAAYETYNLVFWLHESDPQCALAKEAFETLQAVHPDFGKREHPDLDVVYHSGPVGWPSPKTAEELLAKTPKEQIDYLLSFAPESPFGPSREGLLNTVSEATTRDYRWSLELATELEARGKWEADLWPEVVGAWARAELNDEQWKEVLTLLDGREELHHPLVNEIAPLLEAGIKKSGQPIPDSCLPIAVDLSEKLWAVLVALAGGAAEKTKDPDWASHAIGHPAGKITLFWLDWLVRERKQTGNNWQGIPEKIRKLLDLVVVEPAYAGQLGRVVLAGQLNFLWSADEPWTRDHILPLFDLSLDGKRALQAFHGFLSWGRQSENLLPSLVPLYEKAFAHLPELGRVRERFAEYLAGLAFASSINPMTHGWLNRFVAATEREDRIRWASDVRRFLRGPGKGAVVLAWNGWIKSYWEQRILGVPRLLDSEELGEMVEWTLHLGPNFPEVVETVWASPKFALKYSSLFSELAATELPEHHPAASGKLLLKVLRNTGEARYDLDKVEDTVRRIAPLHAPLDILKDICSELGRLGYPPAGALLAWLEGRHP